MWAYSGWHGRWQDEMEDFMCRGRLQRQPVGNHAFDEYRKETLRRLEGEQSEFNEFLTCLRMAKDKAEFDQFMTNRTARPSTPSTSTGPQEPTQNPQG